jgi:molybdopterin molybdotransferase
MILLEDALTLLLDHTPYCGAVRLPLAECFGRVLAEDITSTMDFLPLIVPPWTGMRYK